MVQDKQIVVLVIASMLGAALFSQQSSNNVLGSEKSPYESGYDHGCDDANLPESEKYINEPEKGPAFHTQGFMDGYYAGVSDCAGNFAPTDEGSRGFVPERSGGGERYYEDLLNWRSICNGVDDLLSESCSDLVTSDGRALTSEGKVALERILCGGGAVLKALLAENILFAAEGLLC